MNPDDVLGEYLEHGQTGEPLGDGAVRVRDLLGSPEVWAQPPAGGLDNLLAQIDAERRAEPAGDDSPAPPAAPGRPASARPGRRLLVAVAAAVVLAAGGVGIWVGTHQSSDRGQRVALAGTALARGASAVAHVRETPSGISIALDVHGLPPAAPGTFYQAWLKSPAGDLVAIGTFHLRGGAPTVQLWAGVDLGRYPLMTVTLQREGAGPKSSGKVLLSGRIAH